MTGVLKVKKISEIFISGHKSPDTDSICSAIAYANLKNKISDKTYIPKRAGEVSKETEFVLNKFGVEAPGYIDDLRPRVSDLEIRNIKGVKADMSLRDAYEKMRDEEAVTLVVTKDNGTIDGIISVGDVVKADVNVYDNSILSKAETPYKNIVATLDGKVLAGNDEGVFTNGKAYIGAYSVDKMNEYLSEGDLIILGDRYDAQDFAIEKGVKCIVLGSNFTISPIIKNKAEQKGCIIISSPYDSFTIARLIGKSMPINHFMSRENVLVFSINDFVNDVKEKMAQSRHRYFPVVDSKGVYVGQISKGMLLDVDKKKIVLVDHNEISQAIDGIETAEILEIIDHHKLGSIETINPIYFRNQPVGCTSTIVYQMYCENGVEIDKAMAGLMCSAILSDTLMFRSPTCTPQDREAVENLAKIAGIVPEEYAQEMFKAGSDLSSKTPEEIFYTDYKNFESAGIKFGVGQITSLNASDLENIKPSLSKFMEELVKKGDRNMLFIMLTNIIDESTTLLFKGEDAKEVVENGFGVKCTDGETVYVPGMVSRKKQLIPQLLSAMSK
jgi:manganese-dependent inorganic pyrophosphatase